MMVFNPFAAIALQLRVLNPQQPAPTPISLCCQLSASIPLHRASPVLASATADLKAASQHPNLGTHRSHLPRRRTHRAPCYVPSQMSRRHRCIIPPPLPQRRQYPATSPSPHNPIYLHGLKTTVQPPFFAIAAATFGLHPARPSLQQAHASSD
ncbi:hypothetical protein M0R45_004465 [Rubus argutus]|uniref:Uncharacterized protein n=1 Tax=Rubus argutus TaxID=59490 RepID=A0AAW1YJW8_RUBAR